MADSRKPTNSSMIDLKAELFRKQEEYKLLKAQNTAEFVKSVKTTKSGKGDKIWSQKNAGVLQRASKDLAEKEEEDNVMDRSRRALEAKSKIYDKIASASGIPDDDGSEGYLVDFQKKAVDRIVEQRRGDRQTGATACVGKQGGGGDMSDDDDSPSEGPIPLPADPSEEWVDYVDTFGRSRRCMKKDLPHLEKQERPLGRPPGDGGLKLKEGATLLSADMKRELRRQQWEKEAEDLVNGPVHYANVQYDEIRTHGTGFYQFSKDSNLREEQMEALNKLREQTMEGRQRSERIKEKRKAALETRLAKVKQRRKMKGGSLLDMEDKKDEEEQKAVEDSTPQEAEPLTRDDSWRSSAPVREWDVGKEKLPEWNAKRYMEQRRSERENEFAPPQFYFNQKGPLPPAREQGAPPSNTRPQAGRDQSTQPSVPASSDTDAMLKQIRNSVGQRDKEASVDLASIPLPQISPLVDNADSAGRVEEGRQEAGAMIKDEETGEISVSQVRQHGEWAGPGYVPIPQQVYAGYQMAFCGPVPDVSLPPPGYPVQPPSLDQPAAPIPPPQSFQPTFTHTSSVPTEQDPSSGSAFVYPSQRGLLSSQQPQSMSQVTPSTVWSSVAKPTISKESRVKGSMVDKRFMQNREVSEEDLLGYMVNTSDDDPLTKVQAVPYTPGLFSAGTSSQLQKPAPEARATSEQETEPGGHTTKPAGQTEGVIFGVPDFLQPAEVTATSYQPGSFMAAKEAAAQRAEEEYEAARKKTQYSSAPVLYGRPEDDPPSEQRGVDSGEDGSKKSSVSPQGEEVDGEYAQFIREVKGKK